PSNCVGFLGRETAATQRRSDFQSVQYSRVGTVGPRAVSSAAGGADDDDAGRTHRHNEQAWPTQKLAEAASEDRSACARQLRSCCTTSSLSNRTTSRCDFFGRKKCWRTASATSERSSSRNTDFSPIMLTHQLHIGRQSG